MLQIFVFSLYRKKIRRQQSEGSHSQERLMVSSARSSSPSVGSGDSASSIFGGVSQEKTNGTRLARLLIDEGTSSLQRFLLFSIHPETLEDVLNKNLPKLQNLRSRRVIADDQWEKLFPGTGDPPNIEEFDITLLHLLIREFSNLPPPSGTGWHTLPAPSDASIEANIARIKYFRNELSHSPSTAITESEFEDKWDKISSALEEIMVYIQRTKIQRLKNDPIDHDTYRIVEEHIKKWRRLQQQQQQQENDEPSSCLPDEVLEVFGRSKEIDEVKQYLRSKTDAVVLITGGPGFGKTTVARETAHKLSKENGHTVLFCSLLKKTTFLEVATEMIHSCGTIVGQLPENPEYWLKNWSKQIQSQVVFVLDNADSLLESEADRALFLEILGAMRMLSKQNVAFVITSRKRFQHKSLPWKEVNLSPLPPDEAKELLNSRVSRGGPQIENFSKVETILELCGCVPLALSIVGSLLLDYPEEKIVEHLEKEPMTILEDGDESFQKAIMNSFDLLTKAEKEALIALSIFPGSFDYHAAEAVLKETLGPETPPITTLRSLNNRSLVVVEQADSHRYQLHSLIRAFAKKIGENENPQVLLDSRELACEHFISRLEKNTRLYWGKDTCKEAIESFSADRQNFEHFLKVFANGLEAQEIATSCKKFLDSLFETFQYLEKCISSKVYIEVLELLLSSTYFQAESQPVHRVELLCLLGQEMRRLGVQTKYKDHMEDAHRLFSAHDDEFGETKVLSRVFYLHSRARFLSHAKKFPNLEPKKLYDKALKICEEKLPDHPETAASLLFAGRNAKRRKDNTEATEKLQRALSLFQKLLGDHFMTAQCLKDFADLVFLAEKSDQGLDKALKYYGKAMGVMEKLGTHEQKESILTLKNYGFCHMRKGNFEEAEKYLLKAQLVCERELEKEHTWKVMVKTQLGLLYHEMADKQENEESVREELLSKMEASMKEGLDMCYKLNNGQKSINHLGDKKLIWKVLSLYPERFPEDAYPREEVLTSLTHAVEKPEVRGSFE
ncbi:nephrocystin-3-like isoform X1 [Montipora foliosa]|uniref:nephrocystin-3-like isoform X1 n=2 Tax=Montipora foliosa TaxID=591990 RepID=UPI0035F13DF3